MANRSSLRIDWDRMPGYVDRAHRLRSQEVYRMLGLLGCKLTGLVRRFFGFPIVPGVRGAGC
jgi:hypothetical protein